MTQHDPDTTALEAGHTARNMEELLCATGRLFRRLRAESDTDELTWSQLSAMARLAHGGAMTTADLARAESVKPQSMRATLAALEREGLVARTPHPSDGRQVLFDLTELGREMRRRNRQRKLDWLTAAVSRLDPSEQQTLLDAIGLIRRLAAT